MEFKIDRALRRSRIAAAFALLAGLVLAGCSANGGLGTGGSSSGGGSGGGGNGPVVTISAAPGQVAPGGTVTLTWSSSDPNASCTASSSAPGSTWTGSQPSHGTQAVTVPTTPGSYAYALSCKNSNGTGTGTATVQVGNAPPPGSSPTVTIQASPALVPAGGIITLTWSSSDPNATCTATSTDTSSTWTGTRPTSGTEQVTAPSPQQDTTYTYTLACTNSNGTGTGTTSVEVSSGTAQAPTVTISANPTTINVGESSTLTWSSTNASACTASGSWSGSKTLSGSVSTGALNTPGTYSYALTCTGAGGSASAVATVIVGTTGPAPTVTLTANPTEVAPGGSVTLTWSTTDATSCTASSNAPGSTWTGTQALNGSTQITAPQTTGTYTYTLTCTGPSGQGNGSATVTVTNNPPPPVTITFTPASQTIPLGGTPSFTWTSTNAASCTATGGDVVDDDGWDQSSQPTSGSFTGQPVNRNTTLSYTLTCVNADSSQQGSATAIVIVGNGGSQPSVTIKVDPDTIDLNGSATVSWDSANVTSCTASGSWSGSVPIYGTFGTGPLTSAGVYTYVITCTGPRGTVSDGATLTVSTTPIASDCGVGTPSSILFAPDAQASSSTSGLCGACSVDNPQYVTDSDLTNFASVLVPLGLLNGVESLTVKDSATTFPAGRTTGFVIATPNQLLTLSLLKNVTVDTLLNDQVQETAGATSSSPIQLNLLGLLGGSGQAYLNFTTTKDFNGVRLNVGSLLSLASNVSVYRACVSQAPAPPAAVNPGGGEPQVTLKVYPTTIDLNASATLQWDSNNISSCTASGAWNSAPDTYGDGDPGHATRGLVSTGSITTAGTYTYTLTCTAPGGGTTTSSATLTVTSTPVQGDCGVGQPENILFSPAATASSASSGLCGACSVDNPQNVTDSDLTNFASVLVPLGLLGGTESLTVKNNAPFTDPRTVGFVVATPNQLLTLSLLKNVTVDTLLNGQVQETAGATVSAPLQLNLLFLLGGSGQGFLNFTTSKPFDALRLNTTSGLASVVSDVSVYRACVSALPVSPP